MKDLKIIEHNGYVVWGVTVRELNVKKRLIDQGDTDGFFKVEQWCKEQSMKNDKEPRNRLWMLGFGGDGIGKRCAMSLTIVPYWRFLDGGLAAYAKMIPTLYTEAEIILLNSAKGSLNEPSWKGNDDLFGDQQRLVDFGIAIRKKAGVHP